MIKQIYPRVEVILCVDIFELCCGEGIIQNRVERRFEREQDSCFVHAYCQDGSV